MPRLVILPGLTVMACGSLFAQPQATMSTSVTLDLLSELARQRAAQPYDEQARKVPDFLNDLGYDQYRDFRFRHERAYWHGENLPFELEFFHPGYLYQKYLDMFEIAPDGAVSPIPFSPEYFEYGPQAELIPQLPRQLGFSGFHLWLGSTAGTPRQDGDEGRVGLFQGASYFRMVSPANEYGLSGRSLAINTTTAGAEEFPDITAFWFERPAPDDDSFAFLAMLEGPSVVGAYRFVWTPGEPIRLAVEARIVLREQVSELGLAPFSTMFWYGENTARRPADFRPEVHDSDGLFIQTRDEYIWRPLSNPTRTRTDDLPGDNLLAYGLQQRDRDYEHYQDIEADYHLRPDAWVVPGAGMQEGSLRLLEIAIPHEYADNMALVWAPSEMPAVGEVFSFQYDVYFGERPLPALSAVVATRYGESLRADGSMEFIIDFQGDALQSLVDDADLLVLDIDSEVEGGEFIWQNLRRNPYNDTWRLTLRVLPDEEQDEVRLSAGVFHAGSQVSETWRYWWMR